MVAAELQLRKATVMSIEQGLQFADDCEAADNNFPREWNMETAIIAVRNLAGGYRRQKEIIEKLKSDPRYDDRIKEEIHKARLGIRQRMERIKALPEMVIDQLDRGDKLHPCTMKSWMDGTTEIAQLLAKVELLQSMLPDSETAFEPVEGERCVTGEIRVKD